MLFSFIVHCYNIAIAYFYDILTLQSNNKNMTYILNVSSSH